MKKTKIIIPALGLLVLSTAASVSGTVAWFSVNSTVSATGMQVQAKAESGLLISADKTAASWANTDATALTDSVALVPTSTANATAWYHAVSNSASNYAHSATYSTLGTTAGTGVIVVATEDLADGDAVANITYANSGTSGYHADDEDVNDVGYYLMTKFFLKSSADAINVNGTSNYLIINDVTIGGITGSAALDASLRIGVKIGEAFKILAPFAAAAGTGTATGAITYTVGGSTVTTAYKGTIATNGSYNPSLNTGFTGDIPSSLSTPLDIDIYLWYEGEDVNCMSNNVVATLDTLTVSVGFELTNNAPTNPAA